MVFDEGFEVRLPGRVFFAFSRYEFIGKPTARLNITDEDDFMDLSYRSMCGETFVGWVHGKRKRSWGCWYGE